MCKVESRITSVMLLSVIRKALVFHGSENDISDEAALMLTEEIIDKYWYLSMPEISYVIRKNFTTKKYKSLSASNILEWIREYDTEERVNAVERYTEHKDPEESNSTITYEEYLNGIKERAENGDEDAIKYLEDMESKRKRDIAKNSVYQLYLQAKAEFFNKRK